MRFIIFRCEYLETFILVVQHSSFAGAARHLHITPAAVAKQVGLLEESLGFQLLNRTTRSLSLTEEGVVFHEQFLRVLLEMKETESLASALKGRPEGHLKIASSLDFGDMYIIPYLPEFLAAHPKLFLEIEFSDRIPDFEKEKVDILVGMITGVPAHMIQRKMMETRYVLCASPSYLKTYGTPRRPEDLSSHKLLNHSGRPYKNMWKLDKGLNVTFDPYLLLNTTRSLLLATINGLGIVYLHEYVVADALKESSLIPILEGYTQERYPLHYFYKPTRYPLPKITAFTQFLMGKIRKAPQRPQGWRI